MLTEPTGQRIPCRGNGWSKAKEDVSKERVGTDGYAYLHGCIDANAGG